MGRRKAIGVERDNRRRQTAARLVKQTGVAQVYGSKLHRSMHLVSAAQPAWLMSPVEMCKLRNVWVSRALQGLR